VISGQRILGDDRLWYTVHREDSRTRLVRRWRVRFVAVRRPCGLLPAATEVERINQPYED
jgi:hypothetical protein